MSMDRAIGIPDAMTDDCSVQMWSAIYALLSPRCVVSVQPHSNGRALQVTCVSDTYYNVSSWRMGDVT